MAKSSTGVLYELLPKIEALGRGTEYRGLLDLLITDRTEAMRKLRTFAYSLGDTDESLDILIIVGWWYRIKQFMPEMPGPRNTKGPNC